MACILPPSSAPPCDVCEPQYALPTIPEVRGVTLYAVSPDGAYAGTGYDTSSVQLVTFFVAPNGQYTRLTGRNLNFDGTSGTGDDIMTEITCPDIIPLQNGGWAVAGRIIGSEPRLMIVSPTMRVTSTTIADATETIVRMNSVLVPTNWGSAERQAVVDAAAFGNTAALVERISGTPVRDQHIILGFITTTAGTARTRRATVVACDAATIAADEAATLAAYPCPCTAQACLPLPLGQMTANIPLTMLGNGVRCGAVELHSVCGAFIPMLEATAIAIGTTPPTPIQLYTEITDPLGLRYLRDMTIAPRDSSQAASQVPALFLLLSETDPPVSTTQPRVLIYDAVTGSTVPTPLADLSTVGYTSATALFIGVSGGIIFVGGNLWSGLNLIPTTWILSAASNTALTSLAANGRLELTTPTDGSTPPANSQMVAAGLTPNGILAAVVVDRDSADPEFPFLALFAARNLRGIPGRSLATVSVTFDLNAFGPPAASTAALRLLIPVNTTSGALELWGDIAFALSSLNLTPSTPTVYYDPTAPDTLPAVSQDLTRRVVRMHVAEGCNTADIVSSDTECRYVDTLQACGRFVTVSSQDAGAAAILAVNGVVTLGDSAGIASPVAGMLQWDSTSSTLQVYDGSAWKIVTVT